MQKNRALRATLAILLAWIGGRSSFLFLSNAETSMAPQQQVVALPPAQTAQEQRSISASAPAGSAMQPSDRAGNVSPVLKAELMEAASVTEIVPLSVSDVPISGAPMAQSRPPPADPNVAAVTAAQPVAESRLLSRASLSAWAIIRPTSSGSMLATNGQLGASQAGSRFQQPILASKGVPPVALNLRISTPLDQKSGREAAVGFSTRPVQSVPAELIIERRIALDRGGRNAFALIAAGGVDDRPLVRKTMLSGYAQAGMVGLARRDGFIDGALRVEQVALARDRSQFRLGAGLWGAAQPGVSRMDVGPIVAVKQGVGSVNLRISAEYRWRVAGQARPASGPVLSIGADF